MKKRPFILLELLLAIAILAIAFIPLAGTPFLYFKKQREKLLEVELQRQAELIFYDLLKDFKQKNPEWKFDKRYDEHKGKGKVLIDIEGLGQSSHPYHYHLYQRSTSTTPSSCYKLWCKICFEKPNELCTVKWNKPDKAYTFNLVVKKQAKKVDQKSDAMHSEVDSQK